jgi:hypothetical protein
MSAFFIRRQNRCASSPDAVYDVIPHLLFLLAADAVVTFITPVGRNSKANLRAIYALHEANRPFIMGRTKHQLHIRRN